MGAPTPPQSKFQRFLRDPLSIGLVLVIVLALGAAGLIGGELVSRRIGNEVVAQATSCVVQDSVSVSFRGATPFLWQHLNKHYSGISITTAGNQIRNIKGMKAQIEVEDVRLANTGNSNGTIGSLNATITWSADGIKQTIQNSVPLIGGFVSGVTTNASDGTVELKVPLGSIIAKPEVVDNGIALQVQQLTGLGFALPRETVQPALDAFTTQITKGYPLGIHADSIQVTDDGVVSTFSSQNASIPVGQDDPCFAGV
jgi:LmeA-like phospholipid-binding